MDKQVKICHITVTEQTGIPRLLRESACSTAAGMQTWIVAPGKSVVKDGIHFIGTAIPTGRLNRMTVVSRAIYEAALAIDADVYQIHDPELLRFAGRLLRRGKKVIFDSHENYTVQIANKQYLPRSLRKAIASLYHVYETGIVKKIDATLIPCTFNGVNIFAGRARRVEIIANYPMADVYMCEAPAHARADAYVCYAGSLSPARGTTQLILAAYKAGVRLVLAGRFSSAEYQREVESMPAFSNVDYRGVVDSSQVVDIYQGALAGMCTLLPYGQYYMIDTLPTKVYEYWMAGLPVILSDAPYNKTVMAKYHGGVCVDPADTQAIADAIAYLLAHPDEARQMGENGRRAVLAEYNWGVEERKLLALYKELEGESNERV